MSNLDENKIKKEAKEILDKFASALDKTGIKESEDFFVEREEFEREEASLETASSSKEGSKNHAEQSLDICKDFKKELLENAPKHDNDFVIAEKGSWKK